MMDLTEIKNQSHSALKALLNEAKLTKGSIVVVGCSTSEVAGERIGSSSSMEIAGAIMDGILPLIREGGLHLCVQCCEHLNRSLVVERACMEQYGLEEVLALPALHAGGALSVLALEKLIDAVVVEKVAAHAGMDIGDTFIGMHLRPVVVPVRSLDSIGKAHLTLARTRAKYIGGPRAAYPALP